MSKPKLVLPAVSFLAGLVLWIGFILWGNLETEGLQWVGSAFCLVISVVFYYSAVQCRLATGGRKGNTVRAIALLPMAIVTYFQPAHYGALILLIAALVIAEMTRQDRDLNEDEHNTDSANDPG